MNDVQAKSVLAAKLDKQTDRGQLRLIRTRAQPGRILPPVVLFSTWIEILGQLCVDQQGQASAGERGRGGLEFLRFDQGQTFDAGIDQEAFEPGHACRCQGR